MNRIKNISGMLLAFCSAMLLTAGCDQRTTDREIKADITSKAKDDINFAGVQFTVENGKVTLLGICPTPKSRELVKQKLSTIHVISSVEDRLLISPVTIGHSYTVKQQVDSILATYPTVIAVVSDNSVALMGSVENKELNKLLQSVAKVQPKIIIARLSRTM
jgi:osmotically-inducible protein OsmY